MGRKCCAPGCKSNYASESGYITVFKFPDDPEKKQLWIKQLPRQNFQPSATAVVCIKHFDERFIIREDRIKRPDGTELVVPRKKITLSADAFPSRFSNLPRYMTKELPPIRKDPNKRWDEIKERDDNNFVEWCKNDLILSFKDFTDEFTNKLNEDWLYLVRNDYILFYKLDDTDCPKLKICFKVFKDLSVMAFHENAQIDVSLFQNFLGSQNKCDRWTKFENILSKLNSYNEHSVTFNDNLFYAVVYITKCVNYIKYKDENIYLKLKFIKQQISLLSIKKLSYSTNLILWCSKIYFTYPSAYILIRNSKFITLPHPSYLRKLTSLCSSAYSCENLSSYFKNKADSLEKHEKIVNVLLDEIYINPSFSYKAGHIFGMSQNSNSAATTIQAFMITSVLSKHKDVVSLFPVRNLTADLLEIYTNKALSMLHECGFTVLTLISDNNRINRNMFTNMCGGEAKPYISNPYDPSKKLFFLFDTVHLIKAMRNNWLNQATENQTIFFPDPFDQEIRSATLRNLKDIYEKEKKSMIKVAPKLSHKVFYPNSIEKQNVTYALNLFDDSNCAALEMNATVLSDSVLDTKLFIKMICQWWKVVNVKHPSKGQHLNDPMSSPIKSIQDENFIFLNKFSEWLNEWDKLYKLKPEEKRNIGIPTKGGMLSKETFFALKFTTNSMIELIKYLFESVGSSYVLLGKFQTDNLEARFGQYRQMSGGNYNVSCVQVMEAEKKLKILSLISLYSEKNGEFKLKDLNYIQKVDTAEDLEIPDFFYDVFNSNDDVEISNDIMSVLIFIAGYIAHKVSDKLNCCECVSILLKEKILEIDCPVEVYKYLMLVDRGKLKWPQEILVFIMINAFQIFKKLISAKYENEFLKFLEPKKLVIQLTLEKIEMLGTKLSLKCKCGNELLFLIKHCLSGIANILLNNYTKVKNDSRKYTGTKRKLSVLANT